MAQTEKLLPRNPLIIINIFLFLIFFALTFHFFIRPLIVDKPIDKTSLAKEAQAIADSCRQKDVEKCYEQKLAILSQNQGLTYAEQTLDALQDIDPFTRSCHVLAHRISEAATRRNPDSWEKFLAEVDVNACGGGFLHGILEAHTSSNPDFVISSQAIDELCSTGSFGRRIMCSHMLAHLVLLQKNGKMEDALTTCDGIRDELRFQCFDGLYMETHQKNIMVDHGLVKPPEYTKAYAKELAQKCDSFDGIRAKACWTEMAEVFAKANNYNKERVFQGCNTSQKEANRISCYLEKGVAILVTYPAYYSLEKIKGVCDPYKNDKSLFTTCLQTSISALMNYTVKFTDRAVSICSNVAEDKSKKDCFTYVGEWLKRKDTSLNEREDLCKNAPEPYKKICANI